MKKRIYDDTFGNRLRFEIDFSRRIPRRQSEQESVNLKKEQKQKGYIFMYMSRVKNRMRVGKRNLNLCMVKRSVYSAQL